MTAPVTHQVAGPLRAQDGRTVYVVMRVTDGARRLALMECLSRDVALREAAALDARTQPQPLEATA